MQLHKTLILMGIFSMSFFALAAQSFHISEEFSGTEWETELLRLNPGNQLNNFGYNPTPYATPATGGGNSYDDLNNVDLYFGKYRLFGSIETLSVQPCSLGDAYTHKNETTNVAVAFRIANPAGYIELPTVPNAGKITIHVRNGNKNIATQLGLEKFDQEADTWIPVYEFQLKGWGSYEGIRDEVLSYIINSDQPIKLRLINNVDATTRFINLYRIEVEEKL